MNDPVRLTVTVFAEAATEAAITAFCVDHLQAKGYTLREPSDEWESIKAFCERLNIHHDTLTNALKQPDCPFVKLHRGRTRLLKLKSNPEFETFVRRNITC